MVLFSFLVILFHRSRAEVAQVDTRSRRSRHRVLQARALLSVTLHLNAKVAELVDAHVSNTCSERSGGSIPPFGTNKMPPGILFCKHVTVGIV